MSYKTIHAFGLDISDSSIEMVVLNKKRKVLVAFRENLPFGVVSAGKIKDKEALAEILLKIKEKVGKKLVTENVIISLPETNVFAHILSVPRSLVYDAKVILKLAQEHIPLNLNEAIFDYKIINDKILNKREKKVFFVAAEDKLIYDYLEVLNKVQLKPIAIDIDPNSITRALIPEKKKNYKKVVIEKKKKVKENKDEKKETENLDATSETIEIDLPTAEIMVDIGDKNTLATIFFDNFAFPSISLPIAGQTFSKIILEKLKTRDFEEAEKLKRKLTINSADYKKIEEDFTQNIQKIISEIKSLITYFEKSNEAKVKTMYLSGGGSHLIELKNIFQTEFNLEIKTAIPEVIVNKEMEEEYFLNATGLALRGISKDPVTADINLLPAVQKRLLIEQQARNVIIYSSLVILFISSLLLASFNIVLSNLYFDLEGLEKANSSFEKIVEGTRYKEIKAHIQELNDTVKVVKQTQEETYSLQEIRNYFYASVPTTVVINQFNYHKKDKNHAINVNGFALSREKVLVLQEKLKNTPFYKNLFAPLSNILNQKNIYFAFSFDLDLEKFKQYIKEVEQKRIDAEKQKAEEEKLKLQSGYQESNGKNIPAFTTASGEIITNKSITSNQNNTNKDNPISLPSVKQDQLQDLGNNLTPLSGGITQEEDVLETQINEILSSTGSEQYPFQEKIHEKVGDIFIIEQNNP